MSGAEDPVEVTTRYATTLGGLASVWAFVMEHLDSVGPDPTIEINPIWESDHTDDRPYARRFTVVVSGMIHAPTTEEVAAK